MTSTFAADVAPPAPPAASTTNIVVEQGDSPIEHDHFVLSGGLRQVKPYLFDFICTVKPRFAGSKLVDFMASEFPSMPREYYRKAAAAGRLRQEAGAGARKKIVVATQGKSKRQLAREAKRARAEGGVVGQAEAAEAAAAAAAAATAAGEEEKKGGDDDEGENVPLVDNATIRHLLHRHEPPALDLPLRVLGHCPESGLWAVGKPPGMPVHAAGGYRKNTVCGLLEAAARAAGAGPPRSSLPPPSSPPSPPSPPSASDLVVPWPAYLHPLHRLDKPVSGVLLFAGGGAAAERCRAQLADRRNGGVTKVYVARVLGRFPGRLDDLEAREDVKKHVFAGVEEEKEEGEEERDEQGGGERRHQLLVVDAALSWDAAAHKAQCSPDSGPKFFAPSFSGAQPSSAITPHQSGRAGAPRTAATSFRLLSVAADGRTSAVECRPLTGRTHQIRAHLGFLGHPIANDALYHDGEKGEGGECVYPGPERPRLEAHGGGKGSGAGGAGCFVEKKEDENGGRSKSIGSGSGSSSSSTENAYISAEDVAELLEECGWSHHEEEGGRERKGGQEAREQTSSSFPSSSSSSLPPLEAETLAACPFCPSLSRPAAACELRPLWLHARLYEGEKEGGGRWKFECPVPGWASEEFVPKLKK